MTRTEVRQWTHSQAQALIDLLRSFGYETRFAEQARGMLDFPDSQLRGRRELSDILRIFQERQQTDPRQMVSNAHMTVSSNGNVTRIMPVNRRQQGEGNVHKGSGRSKLNF